MSARTDQSASTVQAHERDGSSSFWKYWAASAISNLGTGVTSVALPLLALEALNASNLEMGVLTAAGYAAVVLVGLPAGVIAQRFPLRTLQVSMDTLQTITVLTVPLAIWFDVLSFPHLLIAAFMVGLAGSLFDVANATYLPRIVPTNELIGRNGLISGTHATTSMAGPALGGGLVQVVGAAVCMTIDAVTYAASALLLRLIPTAGRPVRQAPGGAPFGEMAAGIRFVFNHRVMRPSVLAATAVNFANGAILAVMAPFLVRTLGLPPYAVGVVLAVDGLGTVVGAAVTAWIARKIGTARALMFATAGGAVVALAMPLAFGPWAAATFSFGVAGFAAGVVVLSVVTRTHRQTVSPPEMLSRVMASVRFVSWSAVPVGSVAAGVAAQVWNPRAGLVLACIAAVAAAVVIWSSQIPRLHELTDAERTSA